MDWSVLHKSVIELEYNLIGSVIESLNYHAIIPKLHSNPCDCLLACQLVISGMSCRCCLVGIASYLNEGHYENLL